MPVRLSYRSRRAARLKEILQRRGFDPETMKPKQASGGAATGGHIIELNGKNYQYKGTGDTRDINNYTEIQSNGR